MADSTIVATQITQVIDHLAKQLSVPAKGLWDILLMQSKVEAIQSWIVLGVWLIVAIGYAKWVTYLVKNWKSWVEKHGPNDDGLFAKVLMTFFGGIALFITMLFFVNSAINGIGYWMNPGYFAIHEILDAIK